MKTVHPLTVQQLKNEFGFSDLTDEQAEVIITQLTELAQIVIDSKFNLNNPNNENNR
jgi:hypothetical protein